MDELIRGRSEYEMRLYTLSLIRTSISFWERQEIQNEVHNVFLKNFDDEWKPKEWQKITQKVLNFADSCGLDATILPDLKDAIINTGMKIYEWIIQVDLEFDLDIDHAFPILWTPLGFVNEVRIFKSIWVNDASVYVDSPDKPIFRIACMLAQEDFIREHETEMIEELKKLPMAANSNNVALEVVNYPDKVYGIISTYVCYFVNRDSENKAYYYSMHGFKKPKEELDQVAVPYLDMVDSRGDHLRENIKKAINEGLILPPEIMAKLCGCAGLFHGIKYYMKKLNGAKKQEVKDWLLSYFNGRSYQLKYDHDCRSRNFWEISTLIAEPWEPSDRIFDFSDNLLLIFVHACPLDSVLWPMVRNSLNNVETTRNHLDKFLSLTLHFMKVDHDLWIPNTRYFYQNLVKKICATFDRRKMRYESQLMSSIYFYCRDVQDFTMLRTVYETDELIKFEGDVEYSRRSVFFRLGIGNANRNNLKMFKKFFDQMFDCPDDRIRFVLGAFHESHLLLDCDFDMWEKLYSMLDMAAPLRDFIDPMKCLCSLCCNTSTGMTNIEKCDKFIKWWHESNEEDQKNLKEKFKESPHLPECFYKLWSQFLNNLEERSLRLLQWLFDSEYEISKFKKEKLSILDLFDASLTRSNASYTRNELYKRIDEFLIFSESTEESLANAKDEIRSKMEELVSKFLTVYNIETLDYLMNWVSVSEEVKRRIFRNLMESTKILKLCEDVICVHFYGSLDVFFNEWILKYCEDISKLKRDLLCEYTGLRSEYYMTELCSIFERLERGERLVDLGNISRFSLFG